MAALEKIRKRSVILAIVIGLGLLAFILEEAAKAMGFIGKDTSALVIGDEKIEVNQFSQLEREEGQSQKANDKQDPALAQLNLVQKLIQNSIINQESEEACFDITDGELSQALSMNPPEEIQAYCQQTGQDPRGIYEQLKKEDPNNQEVIRMKMLYEKQAKDIIPQLEMSKMQTALIGCLQANKIDIALQEEESATYDVECAVVDYSELAANYKVSDAELKEAYELYKEAFKIDQEQRLLSYIKIDVDPSANDIKAANKKITLIDSLLSQQGVKGIRSLDDPNLSIDSLVTTDKSKTLTQAIKGTQENKEPFYEELLAGGINNMYKQLSTTPHDRKNCIYKVTTVVSCPDSIGLNQVFVVGNKQRQDSVFKLLASGELTIDSIKAKKDPNIYAFSFKEDGQEQTTSGLVTILAPNSNGLGLIPQFLVYNDDLRQAIVSHIADKDFFKIPKINEGNEDKFAVFAQVAKYKENINLYSIARATYITEPSTDTKALLKKGLQDYISSNKKAADFKKNAAKGKFNVQEEVVDAFSAMLGMMQNPYTGQVSGIPDTRRIVQWAFDSKPGDVSTIYENDEYMIVAALQDVYKDYMPYNAPSVKQILNDYVLNKKIGKDLMNKYNKKANDVAGYAKLFNDNKINATLDTITVAPGAQMLDAKVAGRIAGLGKNGIGKVQVIAGDRAFYVFRILEQKEQPRKLSTAEATRQFQSKNLSRRFEKMLMTSRKIKNNLLKFSK